MKKGSSTAIWTAVASPLILLVGGAVVALCVSSSPESISRELRDPAVIHAVALSLKTTAVSLMLVLVCGTALAFLIQLSKGIVGSALELLITLPAIMPPSVAGIALLLAFGRQGLFGPTLEGWGIRVAFTSVAVVMAQTFVAAPFYVREAANAFQAIEPSLVEAARIDGANQLQLLRRIVLPVISPFLITGAVLAWTRALGEFGATILFAGSLEGVTQTLPLAIYLGFESNLDQAKAIALILLAVAAVVLVVLRLLLRRRLVYAH